MRQSAFSVIFDQKRNEFKTSAAEKLSIIFILCFKVHSVSFWSKHSLCTPESSAVEKCLSLLLYASECIQCHLILCPQRQGGAGVLHCRWWWRQQQWHQSKQRTWSRASQHSEVVQQPHLQLHIYLPAVSESQASQWGLGEMHKLVHVNCKQGVKKRLGWIWRVILFLFVENAWPVSACVDACNW